jgi:hypothetical protein
MIKNDFVDSHIYPELNDYKRIVELLISLRTQFLKIFQYSLLGIQKDSSLFWPKFNQNIMKIHWKKP